MYTLYTKSLKERGHALIDELVELGEDRTRVYYKLGHKMRRPQKNVHFTKVNDDKSLEIMCNLLEGELARRKGRIEKARLKKIADRQRFKVLPKKRKLYHWAIWIWRKVRYRITVNFKKV